METSLVAYETGNCILISKRWHQNLILSRVAESSSLTKTFWSCHHRLACFRSALPVFAEGRANHSTLATRVKTTSAVFRSSLWILALAPGIFFITRPVLWLMRSLPMHALHIHIMFYSCHRIHSNHSGQRESKDTMKWEKWRLNMVIYDPSVRIARLPTSLKDN